MGVSHDWIPPGVFNSQICPHRAPSRASITVRGSLPNMGSHGGSCCLVSHGSCVGSSFSPASGGSCLPRVLASLTNPRRIAGFFVCSAFYLLLGQSGDSRAPSMWNWKLNVPFFLWLLTTSRVWTTPLFPPIPDPLNLQWMARGFELLGGTTSRPQE